MTVKALKELISTMSDDTVVAYSATIHEALEPQKFSNNHINVKTYVDSMEFKDVLVLILKGDDDND